MCRYLSNLHKSFVTHTITTSVSSAWKKKLLRSHLEAHSCLLFAEVGEMAYTTSKQLNLPALTEPKPKQIQENGVKKKYRRSRSAPADFIFPGSLVQKPSKSIFDKLHPSFTQVSFLLFLYLGLGTLCFYLVRHQLSGEKTHGIVDAMYFCVVTMTTVGYGDLVPRTAPAKLLACVFVFTGMALVGLFLSKGADYLVEKQEKLLVKALHTHTKDTQSKVMNKAEMNKTKFKFLMLLVVILVLMSAGIIVLCTVENMNFVDAFYCVCSTITTLGFGDESFSTNAGRIFAVFWILTSTICLAQCFLYLAEINTERRRKSLVKWVLRRRMTYVDIEAADLDNDGELSAAEFILYKLKELGKITQEDIAIVMEEFEDLDVDQSGTLSARDLTLAQSSQPEP